MKRRVIKIDADLCNGCGLCVKACHEGAIGLLDGKAKLMRDDYCDGLGDCLPACPTGAITFEEREAAAYDAEAVKENTRRKKEAEAHANAEKPLPCGCPGSNARKIDRAGAPPEECAVSAAPSVAVSRLTQWPVQIRLVPVKAPYFDGANLLVAADCSAFARGNFHNEFIKNHVAVIGCPKLDAVDYAEKLTEILKNNDVKSLKIVRMEVPCCGGIENAAKRALQASGKFIPWQVVTISVSGEIL